MILSLDISLSNTGGCVFTDDGEPLYLFSVSTSNKDDTKDRLREIGNFLERIKSNYNIKTMIYEKSFNRYNKSTQAIYQVIGISRYIFSECEQFSYAPSSIKKVVTGNGKSDKKIVEEYVLKIWPDLKFDNNDQSDAVAVGLCHFVREGIKNVKRHL